MTWLWETACGHSMQNRHHIIQFSISLQNPIQLMQYICLTFDVAKYLITLQLPQPLSTLALWNLETAGVERSPKPPTAHHQPGVKGLMTLSTACLVNSSTVQIRTCCRGQRSHAAAAAPPLSQSGTDAVFLSPSICNKNVFKNSWTFPVIIKK